MLSLERLQVAVMTFKMHTRSSKVQFNRPRSDVGIVEEFILISQSINQSKAEGLMVTNTAIVVHDVLYTMYKQYKWCIK